MLNHYFLPAGAVATLLLLAPLAPARAQAPIITAIAPAANARAVPRNSSVTATFSQPLTATSAGALKVYSSQRGGLRGGGTAAVAGNTLTFYPTGYGFRPGETVQYSITRAVASAGGPLATPYVGQFATEAAGTGRGTFATGATYAQVAAPGRIVTGDLNGDGLLDLAVSNEIANTVSLRLSGGSTGLVPGTDVPVGQTPRALALADLDGDGDLDLLVCNTAANTVSVRFNSGTGTFSGTLNLGSVAQPSALAVGDLDGDGDLDVLVTPGSGTLAQPLLNNGSGGSIRVGANPGEIAIGDLDNDGDLDFATANNGAATITIGLNNGIGEFRNPVDFATSNGPFHLALADVDRDNDLDVLVACASDNLVRLHVNNGAGQFTTTYAVPTLPGPGAMALGDIDADGELDLLVATTQDSRLGVWTNSGFGTFSTSSSSLTGAGPQGLAVGDLDNDGDLDWATANYGASTIMVRLNGGTGPLATAPGTAPGALTAYPNPAIGRVQLSLPPTATHAELLDALGRVVRVVAAPAGLATVEVSGLAPGLYVVRAAGQVARLVVE